MTIAPIRVPEAWDETAVSCSRTSAPSSVRRRAPCASGAVAVAQSSNPLQGAALRQTLDVTPTAPRPPSPFPGARSLGTSGYGQ